METRRRIKGTMLWFAEAKDHGYIRTETDERLFVDRDGFVEGAAPIGRCAGLPVEFTVSEREGRRVAIQVAPVVAASHGRARRRSRG
jgi:hypothetical protein